MNRIFATLFAAAALACSPAAADITGTARVIDGDTIAIAGENFRINGIDAPERSQECTADTGVVYRCGQAAKHALADKVAGADVTCAGVTRDRYRRILATCYRGSEDLGAWMVASGWALAYRQYSIAYVKQEAAAREAKLGMWRGQFVPPWDWRKRQRTK